MSFVKQKEILDKTVIGPDGNAVGVVREVAFSLAGELGFIVAPASGSELTIPFSRVLAVGEFILVNGANADDAPVTAATGATTVPVQAPVAHAPAPAPAPVAAPPVHGAAPAVPTGDAACPKCGKATKAGLRFCVGCGQKLTEG